MTTFQVRNTRCIVSQLQRISFHRGYHQSIPSIRNLHHAASISTSSYTPIVSRKNTLTHYLPSSLSSLLSSSSSRNKNRTIRSMSTHKNYLLDDYSLDSPECNIPPSIVSKLGKKLHLQKNHPLHTIKSAIEEYWKQTDATFRSIDDLNPIASTHSNFDVLRIEPNHVSRSKSDTYYLNHETVLRTHTSAHQVDLLSNDNHCFLVSGDVYRRDEIDASHYPVFHQMEGVKVFTEQELEAAGVMSSEKDRRMYVERHLKQSLEGMVSHLFGDVEMRWGDDYFPFTHPSFELEIHFKGEWLEVLGCGVIHPDILQASNRPSSDIGWAFGLGLERLAMILFSIPDIRLFWTEDPRFHTQFASGDIVTFQPYSKYPPCFKDVSFWLSDQFHSNDFMEIVRNVAGDIVEQVVLVDEFSHPKTGKMSHCYRISYRSMDRSLTNEEVDALQMTVRDSLVTELGVELR